MLPCHVYTIIDNVSNTLKYRTEINNKAEQKHCYFGGTQTSGKGERQPFYKGPSRGAMGPKNTLFNNSK